MESKIFVNKYQQISRPPSLCNSSNQNKSPTTMASLTIFNRMFLLSLLCSTGLSLWPGDNGEKAIVFPPTCDEIECPKYDVIHTRNDFQIRHFNSCIWTSTDPIDDISLVKATRTGFHQLFSYIEGNNSKNQAIEMTGPVVTQVKPSGGTSRASSFVVSFYVAKENQPNPPTAKGLHVQKWGRIYAAVRQFGGFVQDDQIGKEVAALYASLAGTTWSAAVNKGFSGQNAAEYIVAQYDPPFQLQNRVNEVWLTFYMQNGSAF